MKINFKKGKKISRFGRFKCHFNTASIKIKSYYNTYLWNTNNKKRESIRKSVSKYIIGHIETRNTRETYY